MTISISETYRSREGTEGDSPSAELRFLIRGTNDDVTVRGLLEASSPLIYLGLRRTDYSFEPLGGDAASSTTTTEQAAASRSSIHERRPLLHVKAFSIYASIARSRSDIPSALASANSSAEEGFVIFRG